MYVLTCLHRCPQARTWPVTVSGEDLFVSCIEKLAAERLHTLWVVDSTTGQPTGVITPTDIFQQISALCLPVHLLKDLPQQK